MQCCLQVFICHVVQIIEEIKIVVCSFVFNVFVRISSRIVFRHFCKQVFPRVNLSAVDLFKSAVRNFEVLCRMTTNYVILAERNFGLDIVIALFVACVEVVLEVFACDEQTCH